MTDPTFFLTARMVFGVLRACYPKTAFFQVNRMYIYIYTVGGVGSPIRRQSGSLNLRKETVFYCGKMEIFGVVHFVLDVFQLRINCFSSVEVEVVDGP